MIIMSIILGYWRAQQAVASPTVEFRIVHVDRACAIPGSLATEKTDK